MIPILLEADILANVWVPLTIAIVGPGASAFVARMFKDTPGPELDDHEGPCKWSRLYQKERRLRLKAGKRARR